MNVFINRLHLRHWLVRVAFVLAIAAPATALIPAVAAAQESHAARDSAMVAGTVQRFHEALAAGDSAGVLQLLGDSLVVLESGDLETRSEYRAHHLGADIEFARAVRSDRRVQRIALAGDAAWVVATSRVRGTFRGRVLDSTGAELMVLTRTAAGWRIAAIHWSSHPSPPQ